MAERDMTPEERARFEKEVVQHEDERTDLGGPASDPQVRDERRKPEGSMLPPPNPD